MRAEKWMRRPENRRKRQKNWQRRGQFRCNRCSNVDLRLVGHGCDSASEQDEHEPHLLLLE